jgi:transcriptional regulator with XRE-family HTH domain
MINLKEARESCDRSKADIARLFDVTEATVARWEKTGEPKVTLSQFPLLLAAYGLDTDLEQAKEELKSKTPTINNLIIEAEQKTTWSPLWIRMSVVVPTSTKTLIDMAEQAMMKVVSHLDDRRPIRLGQLLINGSAEIVATHGLNDLEDEAC